MSEVQTDIHKYFKARRNYSDSKGKDLKAQEGKASLKSSSPSISKGSKGQKKKSNSLLSYFERASNDALNESPSGLGTAEGSPCVTPKRKISNENLPERKRKRIQEEDNIQLDDCNRTPVKNHDNEKSIPKSARKQITSDFEGLPSHPSSGERSLSSKMEGTTKILSIGSPSKLNVQQVKEQLGKCNRLDELRARLLKLNQCEEKLRQFKNSPLICSPKKGVPPSSPSKLNRTPRKALFTSPEESEVKKMTSVPPSPHKLTAVHPQLKHFRSLDVVVPVSPVKSPLKPQSPMKSPYSNNACYQRFSHLVEPSVETQLTLPFHYQFLKEIFRAVDTVVSLLHNRHELITFGKLKPAVQEMMRKAFYEKHCGQIKTVFPLAYFFKREKLKGNCTGDNRNEYHLTVAANMAYKQSPVATNLMDKFQQLSSPSTFRKMDSVVIVERRQIFHDSLLTILKQHHTEFLESLDPPISLSGSLKRWHPEFPIEEIDEPVPSPLPLAPTEEVFTARGLLDRAQDILCVNKRLKSVLENEAASQTAEQTPNTQTTTSSQTAVSVALKGVSLSLLEKIRAKEAAKAAKVMTRTTSENKELEMLSRLPEIARILRNIFVTEKRAAIPWEIVTSKVSSSYSSILASSEVDAHLQTLVKELPEWCTIHKVRGGTFIKINKTKQLQEMTDKLQRIIKQRS